MPCHGHGFISVCSRGWHRWGAFLPKTAARTPVQCSSFSPHLEAQFLICKACILSIRDRSRTRLSLWCLSAHLTATGAIKLVHSLLLKPR